MSREGEGARKSVRCAIYARKSTEEGLEQAFNTLDAQREACEAYIKSQAGEGWRALPDLYDDGGFSGGNIERPALRRLLADIEASKIDTIVVYKVDRLTRSLMDFVRIVEKLDARNVSFVSVTQAFNTTSSMGRLTLNVLLSFAQFEREVTGERIRDKVAASKAKGMWMGGSIPLGYDLRERILVENKAEADQVRNIFQRYLQMRSVPALTDALRNEGALSKQWVSARGRKLGGVLLGCGALYYILQNRTYRGEVVHRGKVFEGQHEAIVSPELFDAVQETLAANRSSRRTRPMRSASCPLLGLVYDVRGRPMGTSFGYGRGGRLYRYYVSAAGPAGGLADKRCIRRVSASGLENLVLNRATRLAWQTDPIDWGRVGRMVRRVEIHETSIHILVALEAVLEPYGSPDAAIARHQARLAPDRLIAEAEEMIRLICYRRAVFHGGLGADLTPPQDGKLNPRLRSMLKTAHRLLEEHSMSPLNSEEHAAATAPEYQRPRRIMAVGLLAPGLQKAMLEGRTSMDPETLIASDLPLAWADQRAMLD